jgi:hypothetical protein
MFCITEQHIDYILDDIRRNGIETEDLQFNLLDHICCLAEQNLSDDGDFEAFYRQTIQQFYRKELRELEEETLLLLTFKHYYTMKKITIAGGVLAVLAYVSGSLFKIMHWPAANIMMTAGILLMTFVFLPMVFILKAREVNSGLEKLTVAIGALLGVLFGLDVLFTLNHWPGATVLWLSTICLSAFIFIPLYCFTGVRKPETRVNTILTTIVLAGFTGLLFTMVRLRPMAKSGEGQVFGYVQNERIWNRLSGQAACRDTAAMKILRLSKELKAGILLHATGNPAIDVDADMIRLGQVLDKRDLKYSYFNDKGDGYLLLQQLKDAVDRYNSHSDKASRIALEYSWLDASVSHIRNYNNLYLLNNLTQLQIYLATTALVAAPVTVARR